MPEQNDLARLEAYSDGVFAIASTLLVLEVRVPVVPADAPASALWRGLFDLWPSYLAFVLGFGSILVMWVNHHYAIRMLSRCSKPFLYANGLLLMTATFMPFPTALLARYTDTKFAAVATVAYAGYAVLTNLAFLVWSATMEAPVLLVKPEVGREQLAQLRRRTLMGVPVYLITALISWWLPVVGLLLICTLWVSWVMISIGDASDT
jgi:uncharacterized membrane protein